MVNDISLRNLKIVATDPQIQMFKTYENKGPRAKQIQEKFEDNFQKLKEIYEKNFEESKVKNRSIARLLKELDQESIGLAFQFKEHTTPVG